MRAQVAEAAALFGVACIWGFMGPPKLFAAHMLAQVAEVELLRSAAAQRDAELRQLRTEVQEALHRAALAAELAPELERLRALVRLLCALLAS